jgi:hypothetical protein
MKIVIFYACQFIFIFLLWLFIILNIFFNFLIFQSFFFAFCLFLNMLSTNEQLVKVRLALVSLSFATALGLMLLQPAQQALLKSQAGRHAITSWKWGRKKHPLPAVTARGSRHPTYIQSHSA